MTAAAPETPADRFDSPDGRTYSGPETPAVTPGQADEVPELFTRWYCAGWPVTGRVTADAWQYALPAEQQFWRSLDAEHAAIAARQPQPAPELAAAIQDIIDRYPEREPAPDPAALRLAVITEVREAASCNSDDGDECERCCRHADRILAAVKGTS